MVNQMPSAAQLQAAFGRAKRGVEAFEAEDDAKIVLAENENELPANFHIVATSHFDYPTLDALLLPCSSDVRSTRTSPLYKVNIIRKSGVFSQYFYGAA